MDTEVKPASPTASATLEGFAKELECVICNSTMVDPRVLSCQHVFCLRCIFQLVKRDRGANVVVRCPFKCDDVTRTTGDVRTLKRNPMIGNLCVTMRQKAFERGTIDACDWCDTSVTRGGEPDGSKFCDRCGSVLCGGCRANRHCDHAYLCAAAEAVSAVSITILPCLMTPRICVFTAADTYAEMAKDTRLAALLSMHGLQLQPIAEPHVEYIVCPQVDVEVKSGTDNGVFSTTIIPEETSFASREFEPALCRHISVASAPSSPELALLNECAAASDALVRHLSTIRRTCSALARRVVGSRPHPRQHTTVRAVLALANAADAMVAACGVNACRPLRRLVLVAHLLNIPHTQRLTERAGRARDDLERRSIDLALASHTRIALGLTNRVYAAFEALISEYEECAAETSDLVLASLKMLELPPSPTATSSSLLSEPVSVPMDALDGVTRSMVALEKATKELVTIEDRLAIITRHAMDSALGEVPMETSMKDHFHELGQKLSTTAGHVRIVTSSWAFVASLATAAGVTPPDLALLPLTIADELSDDQKQVLGGVDQLVDSLLPQIFEFRKQHFDMVNASPHRDDPNRQGLLEQLAHLILQALDLFCKDQLMRGQALAGLFSRVRAYERELVSLRPEVRLEDGMVGSLSQIDGVFQVVEGLPEKLPLAVVRHCRNVAMAFAAAVHVPKPTSEEETEVIAGAGRLVHADETRSTSALQKADVLNTLRGVMTSSVDLRIAPVKNPELIPNLPENLRTRAKTLAIEAFKKTMPKTKASVTATLVHANVTGYILLPVAIGSVTYRRSSTSAIGAHVQSLYRRLGMLVAEDDPAPADVAQAAVTMDYSVDTYHAVIVSDDPPIAPLYASMEKAFNMVRRPVSFALLAASLVSGIAMGNAVRIGLAFARRTLSTKS
jgi:hypothetical protein